MPLSLGPGFNSVPEECVVLGRVCVLGELEKAPSDGIAKGGSGTVSLPAAAGLCVTKYTIPKETLSEYKIILLVVNKNVLFAVC